MRQETNKEIDLLLRRLSRRDGEAVRDAETHIDESHLDADELSSYAQNVAPPKARARYTQHLAECSTCRRLATELSIALGTTTAAAPIETVSPASGLKRFLSGLLSPMVLRYAAPALGVIVVMTIGFVVLRQREAREALMAGVNPTAQAPIPNSGPASAPLADQRPNSQEGQRVGANASEGAKPTRETAQARESGPVEPVRGNAGKDQSQPAETADTAAAAPPPVTTPGTGDIHKFTERQVSQLPVVSATPVASLSPQANITTDGESKTKQEEAVKRETKAAAKTVEVQAAASAKEQTNEPPRDTSPRTAKSVPADRVEQAKARDKAQDKAKPDSNTSIAGSAAGRSATRRRADDAKDEAETRSVAGRRFRKEEGIWTDTAYDGSSRTVNMARGSEQFRALVADEPAIGKIAEQLDGEVIVVWKGRPYRIR